MVKMIQITFPDGAVREYNEGITGLEIAKSISNRLAKEVLAVSLDGEIIDSTRPITKNGSLKLHTWDDDEGKHAFWHSSAHLLAQALEKLYPDIKLWVGPAIEVGFYYDVDLGDKVITESDFPKIEKTMIELAREKSKYERQEIAKAEALSHYKAKGDEYKVDLIEGLEDGTITFYKHGDFSDLCRGPHLPDTGYIKAVKILNVAGAYWKGDETNKQLTRVYGVSFPKQK